MAQWLTDPTSTREDAGLIPGLAPWVRNRVGPRAGVWVADAARILRGRGCAAGRRLRLRSDPSLGNLHGLWVWP